MPGLEHETQEQNKIASNHRYAECASKVRKRGYFTESRIYTNGGFFAVKVVWIEDRTSTECRYDKSESDPACSECGQRGSGERYAAFVRANGS